LVKANHALIPALEVSLVAKVLKGCGDLFAAYWHNYSRLKILTFFSSPGNTTKLRVPPQP
jgi:hypothetical protein